MKALYLDDIRNPTTNRDWHIARSVSEAIDFINANGMPSYISFDHDLGPYPEPTGYDFAKWIVNSCLDGDISLPEDFDFNVHSANPVGSNNITLLLDNFINEIANENNKSDRIVS
jgi:hypothetical protein